MTKIPRYKYDHFQFTTIFQTRTKTWWFNVQVMKIQSFYLNQLVLLLNVSTTLSCILAYFQDSTCYRKLAFPHLDHGIPNSSTNQDAKLNHKPNIYLKIVLPKQGRRGDMHACKRSCSKVIIMIAPITVATRGQNEKCFPQSFDIKRCKISFGQN